MVLKDVARDVLLLAIKGSGCGWKKCEERGGGIYVLVIEVFMY